MTLQDRVDALVPVLNRWMDNTILPFRRFPDQRIVHVRTQAEIEDQVQESLDNANAIHNSRTGRIYVVQENTEEYLERMAQALDGMDIFLNEFDSPEDLSLAYILIHEAAHRSCKTKVITGRARELYVEIVMDDIRDKLKDSGKGHYIEGVESEDLKVYISGFRLSARLPNGMLFSISEEIDEMVTDYVAGCTISAQILGDIYEEGAALFFEFLSCTDNEHHNRAPEFFAGKIKIVGDYFLSRVHRRIADQFEERPKETVNAFQALVGGLSKNIKYITDLY